MDGKVDGVAQTAAAANGVASKAANAARAAGAQLDAIDKAQKRLVYDVVLSANEANFPFGRADLPTAARAKIDEAAAQLAAGKDFAEVAQIFSEDRVTANRGGDMGSIREGAIDARFSEAAFALSQGQVSAPVETAFGFHLIRALEAAKVHTEPLSAVESDIRYKLRAQAKERELARLEKEVTTSVQRGDYMPVQTNLAFRQFGIALFFAAVGLAAGPTFFNAVFSAAGLLWLATGVCITVLPLLLAGAFARVVLKMNFAVLGGLILAIAGWVADQLLDR